MIASRNGRTACTESNIKGYVIYEIFLKAPVTAPRCCVRIQHVGKAEGKKTV